MRLPTEKELIVIDLLLNGEETYAWDLVKRSEGRLAQNGVYVILMRMVARGLLSDRLDETTVPRPGPRRRLYRLTAEGRAAREAYQAAVEKYPRGALARAVFVVSFLLVLTVLTASGFWTLQLKPVSAANAADAPHKNVPGDIVDVTYTVKFSPSPQNVADGIHTEADHTPHLWAVADAAGDQPALSFDQNDPASSYGSGWGDLATVPWVDDSKYGTYEIAGDASDYNFSTYAISDAEPGQWYRIAEAVPNSDLLRTEAQKRLWKLVAFVCLAALVLMRRYIANLFRWSFAFGLSTFAEEIAIAHENRQAVSYAYLVGFGRALMVGLSGASPLMNVPFHRFRK